LPPSSRRTPEVLLSCVSPVLAESSCDAFRLPRPVLALFGPNRHHRRCLFLRVKRTSQLRARTSEFDPKATLSCCAAMVVV